MTEEEFLSVFKTSIEFQHDYNNLQECIYNVNNYERNKALNFLDEMVREYKNEINIFGVLVDGIHTEFPLYLSDQEVKDQLIYLSRHIPFYSLIKKGKEEFAMQLYKWINENIYV